MDTKEKGDYRTFRLLPIYWVGHRKQLNLPFRRDHPLHPKLFRLIQDYLDILQKPPPSKQPPLFLPINNNRTGTIDKHLHTESIYQLIKKHGRETGLSDEVKGLCAYSMRTTAATNALSHDADVTKVQEWLEHENIATTRIYDCRKSRPPKIVHI